MANEELLLFLFQQDLAVRLKRAENREQAETAAAIRAKIDEARSRASPLVITPLYIESAPAAAGGGGGEDAGGIARQDAGARGGGGR